MNRGFSHIRSLTPDPWPFVTLFWSQESHVGRSRFFICWGEGTAAPVLNHGTSGNIRKRLRVAALTTDFRLISSVFSLVTTVACNGVGALLLWSCDLAVTLTRRDGCSTYRGGVKNRFWFLTNVNSRIYWVTDTLLLFLFSVAVILIRWRKKTSTTTTNW